MYDGQSPHKAALGETRQAQELGRNGEDGATAPGGAAGAQQEAGDAGRHLVVAVVAGPAAGDLALPPTHRLQGGVSTTQAMFPGIGERPLRQFALQSRHAALLLPIFIQAELQQSLNAAAGPAPEGAAGHRKVVVGRSATGCGNGCDEVANGVRPRFAGRHGILTVWEWGERNAFATIIIANVTNRVKSGSYGEESRKNPDRGEPVGVSGYAASAPISSDG